MLNLDVKFDRRAFERTDDGLKLKISNDETNCLAIVEGKLTILTDKDETTEVIPETLSFNNDNLNDDCLITKIISEKGDVS